LSKPNAVAIGGGTGLPRVLSSLLSRDFDVTAVVTVADDGGSSGRLRREFGILPPGDARNCLAALAEPGSPLAAVFQYRFEHGHGLAGHALGNLVIAALADIEGGFAEALDVAGELLGARGRVLPSTITDVVLVAELCEGGNIKGQAAAANSNGPLRRVHLEPAEPPAFAPALEAIRSADLVVLGPGSLFTSLLPNFLVAGVTEALRESRARKVYVCNVANQRGETSGMDAVDHVRALFDHGLGGAFDVVLAHDSAAYPLPPGVEPVVCDAELALAIMALGPAVVTTDLVDRGDPRHHDPDRLGDALVEVT
jgi:uncharacterized cofD-like protein